MTSTGDTTCKEQYDTTLSHPFFETGKIHEVELVKNLLIENNIDFKVIEPSSVFRVSGVACYGEGVAWTFLAAEEDVYIARKVLKELPFEITTTANIQGYSDNEESRKLRKALAWLAILILTCFSLLLVISFMTN